MLCLLTSRNGIPANPVSRSVRRKGTAGVNCSTLAGSSHRAPYLPYTGHGGYHHLRWSICTALLPTAAKYMRPAPSLLTHTLLVTTHSQDMVERCSALLQQAQAVRQEASELELGRNSAAGAMAGLQDDLGRARGEACVLAHVCHGGLSLGRMGVFGGRCGAAGGPGQG